MILHSSKYASWAANFAKKSNIFHPVWDRLRPSETVWDRLRPSETVWDRLRPSETVWDRLRPSETVWDRLRPSETVWDRLRPSETVWDRLRPSETVWDRLRPSETVWDRLRPSETVWLRQTGWTASGNLAIAIHPGPPRILNPCFSQSKTYIIQIKARHKKHWPIMQFFVNTTINYWFSSLPANIIIYHLGEGMGGKWSQKIPEATSKIKYRLPHFPLRGE